jgi:hypothetical protein
MEALSKPRPKSAVKHTVTGKRLNFAEEIAYIAHKGYAPKVAATVPTSVMWTKSLPSISFKSVKPIVDSLSKDVNGSTSLLDPTNGCSDSEREENAVESTGLEKVVDDIAFRFWDCSRCLSMGHKIPDCTRRIRCRKCFRFGHIEKSCFNRFSKSLQQWVPKKIQAKGLAQESDKNTGSVDPDPCPSTMRELYKAGSETLPRVVSSPAPPRVESSPDFANLPPRDQELPSAMAAFEVDPFPWLPWGHQIIDGGATRLPRTYYYATQDPPS